LESWIRCVFHGNINVHRANETLKQPGFAFLSYLEQGAQVCQFFYNCGRSLDILIQLKDHYPTRRPTGKPDSDNLCSTVFVTRPSHDSVELTRK